MLVCVEDPLFIAAVTGLVGLAIGIVAIMAFRFSDRTRDSADLHSNNELPDGIAEVLAVLPSAAIVVDAGNDVIKASPAAYTFGLVRGHRIVASELAAVIDRVRTRGLIEETNFETQRGRSRQALRHLHARVAPLGAAFTALALVTGALWGRPTWGTFWEWDGRMTSTLVLFLIYLGIIALWRAFEDPLRAARFVAVLTLVGAVNIPIVKFSVDWWATLHQPASVFRADGPTMPPQMLVPLLVMALAFTALFAVLHLIGMKTELANRRIATLERRLAEREP